MNISKNIRRIISDPARWDLYTNRSYRAQIRRADPQQIYNVPGKPGIVYNFMEDAYEKVADSGYVVTGIMGEMWSIGADTIRKYDIDPGKITSEPVPVYTAELDTVYAAVMIPHDTPFTLEADYGEKAMLHGNRPGIEHGSGDYILAAAKLIDGKYRPDLDDSGRIINGTIFDRIYKPFRMTADSLSTDKGPFK